MSLAFKACPSCGRVWGSREDFMADPEVELIGYQVDAASQDAGLFLFNHRCEGTLAIPAAAFVDLVGKPLHAPSLYGTKECEGHCLHCHDIDPCRAFCECAYVRQALQVVRRWPKREDSRNADK
jgi:hypothetical protein